MACLFIRLGRYPPMPKCELARRGRLHIPEEHDEYTASDEDSGRRKRRIGTSECDRVGQLYFLLLTAPTWLSGHCGRHNSPPASTVIDFVFCCPDSSHISVDTVHPSLLWSSSSPRWYPLQSLSSQVVPSPESFFPGGTLSRVFLPRWYPLQSLSSQVVPSPESFFPGGTLSRVFLPRWYHLQSLSSDVFVVSSLHVSNPPQSRQEMEPRIRR